MLVNNLFHLAKPLKNMLSLAVLVNLAKIMLSYCQAQLRFNGAALKHYKHRCSTPIKASPYCKQNGFTAIELLFALGIIAVATVVIVKLMENNSNKAKAQQMIADVSAITNNVRSAYNGSNYSGLDTQSAINEKVIPDDLNISGDTISNQFPGGTISITAINDTSFTISYTNVPSSVCNEVITHIGAGEFSSITANDKEVYSGSGTIDPKVVADACSNTGVVAFIAG